MNVEVKIFVSESREAAIGSSPGWSDDELRESSGTRGLRARQRWRRAINSQTQSIRRVAIQRMRAAIRVSCVFGFAGCDSVESSDVENRLLVAERRGFLPRVTLDSQSEPALTRGYFRSPASRLGEMTRRSCSWSTPGSGFRFTSAESRRGGGLPLIQSNSNDRCFDG